MVPLRSEHACLIEIAVSAKIHMIFKVGQFDLFGQIILSGLSNQMLVRLFRPLGQRIHRIDYGLGKTLIQKVLQRDGAIFDDIVQDGDELKSRVAKLRQQSQ